MWQLIVLAVFLTTAHANLQNFYGNWTSVMHFPGYINAPTCFTSSISKDNDLQCQCADGKITTLLDFYFPTIPHKTTFPVLKAETATEVVSSLGVSCSCGGEYHPRRFVARRINDNYVIIYHDHINKEDYSSTEPNQAIVLGRTVQNASEIQKIVNQVDDLSRRIGKVICSPA